MRTRLDAELVRRGLARSREHAVDLIESRSILVRGIPASKPATQVDAETSITLAGARSDYVSRGGHKLAGALDAFPEILVDGKVALDAGASTGGFTDVLLKRGASKVIAVDVGYGQLAWELRQDPRVEIHDRTNVRNLSREIIQDSADIVVADLSFISLSLVLPALAAVSKPSADFVLMVKPQFEVGREKLGAGGVLVGGVDATADALASLEAGELATTVFQDASGQGAGGVKAAISLINGEKVDDYVDVPYQLVTLDNIADFEGK